MLIISKINYFSNSDNDYMTLEQIRNLIGKILIPAIFIHAIPVEIMNSKQTIKVISNKNKPNTMFLFL